MRDVLIVVAAVLATAVMFSLFAVLTVLAVGPLERRREKRSAHELIGGHWDVEDARE